MSALGRRLQSRLAIEYCVHGPSKRLHLARSASVNDALFNLGAGEIFIGEWAMFGHGVMILTGTHDITKFGEQRQNSAPRFGRDVHIGEGAWLASRVTVLGPCRIGAHAVVAAGSLVNCDVEPYAMVAGCPARVVKIIPHDE